MRVNLCHFQRFPCSEVESSDGQTPDRRRERKRHSHGKHSHLVKFRNNKKSFYLHTAPGERTGMEPSAAGRAPYRAEHGREQQRALPWCWMGTLRKGKAKSHILIFHSLAYCSFKKDVWKVFHSTLFLHTPSKIRKGQLAPAAQSPQTPSPLSLIDVAPKSHGGIWGRVLPPVGRGMRFSRHTIINPTVRS